MNNTHHEQNLRPSNITTWKEIRSLSLRPRTKSIRLIVQKEVLHLSFGVVCAATHFYVHTASSLVIQFPRLSTFSRNRLLFYSILVYYLHAIRSKYVIKRSNIPIWPFCQFGTKFAQSAIPWFWWLNHSLQCSVRCYDAHAPCAAAFSEVALNLQRS